MPSTTTLHSGEEFRLFVQDALAARDAARLAARRRLDEETAIALPKSFRRRAARFTRALGERVEKAALIAVVALAATGLAAQWRAASPQQAPPSPPPREVWLDIAKPLRVYDLVAPQLAREKFSYAARRHSTGGGREDLLTFGEFAGKKWFFRLSVYRHGEEKRTEAPFFVDMARRAAPLGLSLDHVKLEETLPTRFGDLETAALRLFENSLSRENCRGFRLMRTQPGVTLTGLACAADGAPLNAPELACLIDRLDLLPAGGDRALRDFFGAAQARKTGACGEIARRR
jgi:hypothetical protein